MAEENNIVKRWYALRTISGKEQKVKELLEAEIKNSDLGLHVYQVLLPTEKIVSTSRAGKKVVKEKPRMSGYIFVEATMTGEIEYELRNTTNIIDFVRNRENPPKPEPVREAEINRMLGAADSDAMNEVDNGVNDYMVGESVKVISGPFNGFIGEIEEVNREKRTLKVMVKVFGRKTPLELENSQVERE
ncbi:MAG: transcription termination/antitermination protein NusG [Bacteroidales bacterium]|nr:transcription termination/antitermination protein NusG [Bacteroidales bacterium]